MGFFNFKIGRSLGNNCLCYLRQNVLGISPPPTPTELCLYTASFINDSSDTFQTLVYDGNGNNGSLQDSWAGIKAVNPSFGGNFYQVGNQEMKLQIISDGSNLEGWYADVDGNIVPFIWTEDTCPVPVKCYESEVMDFSSYPDATISSLFGYQYVVYGQVFFVDSGSYQNLDDYIKGTYGTQASASIVDLGSGQYKVVVTNISLPAGAELTIRIDLDGIQPPVTFTMNEIPC